MKPSHTLCSLTMFLATLPSAGQVATETDSLAMRREADAFLARMPEGLQRRQCDAVRAATAGQRDALLDIRRSRDVPSAGTTGVSIKDIRLRRPGGRDLPMRLYTPADRPAGTPLPLLVYFHGGGWTFGSLNSCARFCYAVAATGQAAVLAVDYALAPEHPYPEGLLDCMAAIDYAAAHSDRLGTAPGLISAGGDSSGGNLAVAAAMRLHAEGRAALRSLVLFYPVVSAWADGSASWQDYAYGFGLDAPLMEAFNEAYLSGGATARNPFVSPSLAPDSVLRSLPPLLMMAAERDILAAQGERFAARLSAAGCKATRTVLPGTVHLFITVGGQERAFRKSVALTAGFLR